MILCSLEGCYRVYENAPALMHLPHIFHSRFSPMTFDIMTPFCDVTICQMVWPSNTSITITIAMRARTDRWTDGWTDGTEYITSTADAGGG